MPSPESFNSKRNEHCWPGKRHGEPASSSRRRHSGELRESSNSHLGCGGTAPQEGCFPRLASPTALDVNKTLGGVRDGEEDTPVRRGFGVHGRWPSQGVASRLGYVKTVLVVS